MLAHKPVGNVAHVPRQVERIALLVIKDGHLLGLVELMFAEYDNDAMMGVGGNPIARFLR